MAHDQLSLVAFNRGARCARRWRARLNRRGCLSTAAGSLLGHTMQAAAAGAAGEALTFHQRQRTFRAALVRGGAYHGASCPLAERPQGATRVLHAALTWFLIGRISKSRTCSPSTNCNLECRSICCSAFLTLPIFVTLLTNNIRCMFVLVDCHPGSRAAHDRWDFRTPASDADTDSSELLCGHQPAAGRPLAPTSSRVLVTVAVRPPR